MKYNTLNVPTGENGRVKNGTFTTTINGKRVFTPCGVYYLVEAFLIESNLHPDYLIHSHMEFSDETKAELTKRYGTGRAMITGDVQLSERINDDNDNLSLELREAAFPIYLMFKSKGW